MEYMFANSYELISIDLSNFNAGKTENMIGMFYNCSKLNSLNLFNI